MAKYDEILEEIKKRKQYANTELNTAQDVINYAQNNGKSYQRLSEDYLESIKKTKENKNWMESTAKKGNIALSNNYQAPTVSSIMSKNVSQKAWEKLNKPTTDVGVRIQQERDELERQQDYYNKNIANSEQYKDYMNRTNKINPVLEYSKNVAQVREQGINGSDKAFAPLLSGMDNIRDLGGSFVQSDGSRVSLPSLNDLKAQQAMKENDNWLYQGYANISQSIGNMLPGIALSAIPVAGKALGATYFGASTFGNARNQALLQGYDSESANTYGLVNATLELGVGKILGGATALLGKSPASKLLSEKLTSKIIANPALSGAISDMVSEFGEEYIQEWLDPKVQAYILDKKGLAESWESSSFFDKQNFYAGMLGALSAGITNAPGVVVQNNNINNEFEKIVDTLQQDGNQKLTKDQVKQLKQTFYNEYNNAIKNNNNVNYDNITETYNNIRTDNKSINLPGIKQNSIQDSNNGLYEYKPSKNTKIDNLRKNVADLKWNNSEQTNNYINMLEQIINDKNVSIKFDSTLPNNINGKYENGLITINPNSDRAGEFIAIHELTHAIGTDSMKNIVNKYMESNLEFKNAVNDLLSKNYNSSELTEEAMADVAGQLFGNQEFINNLSKTNPNLFKRIYNEIKYLWHQFRGYKNQNQFIEDLQYKWEQAYRSNNLNNTNNLSKQTDSIGKFVNIDVDQSQFDNLTLEQQRKLAKDILNKKYNGMINEDVLLSKRGIKEYTNPQEKISNSKKRTKYRLSTELDNLYEVSKKINKKLIPNDDSHKYHDFAKDGWNYYYARFKFGNKEFIGKINEGISNGNPSFYNVTDIYTPLEYKKMTENGTLNKNESALIQSFLEDNIPQKDTNVNDISSTKYSIQENENNTQDNQGRKLSKEQQKYFKNSVVRDEKGNLKEVYHGTPYEFNRFNYDKLGENTSSLGPGFYFTDKIETANEYQRKGGNVKSVYLDIQKPLVYGKTTISKNEYKKFIEAINKETNGTYFEDYGNLDNALMEYDYGGDDIDLVMAVQSASGLSYEKTYDILRKTTGYDGIISDEGFLNEGETLYVALNSNQIKNVDNTNPSINDDIRYSKDNSTWQEYLEDNFKSSGTRTKLGDITRRVLNPNEISKLKPEDANTTPKLPNKTRNKTNDGDSSFFNNINEKTNMLNDKQKEAILSNDEVKYYDKITNKESLNEAFDKLNKNGSFETERWFNKKSEEATATDVAEGWILLKQYADNNNTDGMVEVAKKLRDMGTKAGQTVQAFNILSRMTPEGMVKYAQSELMEAYDNMVKNKTQEWINQHRKEFDLDPDEVKFIMDTMKEVSKMEDGYDKRVKLAEIQKLITDKIPPDKGKAIKSWMRISMLFNPKTQVRNVLGNAIIAPVNYFGDIAGSIADKIIAKKTGVRTTGKINIKAILKGFKEGSYQATNDYKKGINTKDMEGNRFEIGEGKSFNEKTIIGKSLNRVDKLLNYVMDMGDRVFSQSSFENSLQNQMILNNTKEITQEMIDIARTESLQRTWNDNNNYTKFVLNIRKGMNKIRIPGTNGYGLGDVLIPFAKTPANLTKAIVDYSPVGVVNALVNYKNMSKAISKGEFTPQMQHKFAQDLGKATAGTMLYILGYALAKAGVISGESDDDKDTRDFLKNTLGVSSYSVKIGDKSFTYDWAQPLAAPLSIMANIEKSKNNKNQALLEGITSSLDSAGSILLEQSFLKSINEVLSDNDGIVSGMENAVLDLPARAIPTLMKQITDLTDSTQRQTFEYDKPLETAVNKLKAKLPGLSKTLAPSVDTLGRDIQKYGGKNNIFNVFLNPANVNTENISDSAKEINRLYQETGKKDIMPRVAPYYINKNGEKTILSSQEKAQYQKESGQIIEKSIEELLNNSKYKKLSDNEKVDIINDIVNYSYNKARKDVVGIDMSNEYNKISEYVNDGGKVSDYYLNKSEIDYSIQNPDKYKTINQITSYDKYLEYQNKIKDVRNNTKDDKNETIKYINSLNLNIPQKAMFIKQYYKSFNSYDSEIIDYINSQKLSKSDKESILTQLGFTIKDGRVYSK